MDLYYKQEITVGVMVLAALAIMFGGLLWLTGESLTGRGMMTVKVRFETVSGLNQGDPVQISGVNVGRVSRVRLQRVGSVMAELQIREEVRPKIDAGAEVRSLDFLGSKFVAYSPGLAEDFLDPDSVIAGVNETELSESAVSLAEEATRTLNRAQAIMSEEVVEQVQSTLAAAERALTVFSDVGEGPIVNDITESLRSVRSAAASLDSIVSDPSIKESVRQLDEITEGVREMTDGLAAVTQQLALLVEQVRSPDGSIGRALTDTTLYNDMHEVLVSLRKLLDDVREHPGRYVNVKVF
jgi:phospholipid/cholesterol/gamma-HCH transport system substrate-binding protein